jgi:hypothetical protein
MSRRTAYILFFAAAVIGAVWYSSTMVNIPMMSFNEAAMVGDSKKKIMVPVRVLKDKGVNAEGGTLTFFGKDREGTESKIFYDGEDPIEAGQILSAAERNSEISVAGHTCGERFHIKSILFAAY